MVVAALAGIWAYGKLGREEDPPFTIKTMVIKTMWPGATTTDTVKQVTDRIEKKLEELPNLDFVRSYTKPGESMVFVNLKDTRAPGDAVQPLWYQVRKKIDDIKHTLPSGIAGPFFNDEFGDTYSLIYALTADGFTPSRAARPSATSMRAELLRVPRRRQGRPDRRAGREDLSRILDPADGGARPRRQHAGRRPCRRRTRWPRAARSTPGRNASRSASPANSPRRKASRRSTSASTTASSG